MNPITPDPGAWSPPRGWPSVRTVDAHAAGEPLRIVVDGFPDPPGATMAEKRSHAFAHHDGLRRLLMLEPRGHADMYGCVVTEAPTADGDFGVLFLHNEGFSTMCGHGIIAVATVAVETGWVPATGPEVALAIDTPAGRVDAVAHVDGGRVSWVAFVNVPSFVLAAGVPVDVPDIGTVVTDIAYGGAFYAYVDAVPLGFDLVPADSAELVRMGSAISRAVERQVEVRHPSAADDHNFVYGTIFVGPPHAAGSHSRNVCVFAEGQIDRSPTGTGVSGRLAIHHARGDIGLGDPIVVESIVGTTFTGTVAGTTAVGTHPAVRPRVSGSAHITGLHQFVLDPEDPLDRGFLVR